MNMVATQISQRRRIGVHPVCHVELGSFLPQQAELNDPVPELIAACGRSEYLVR
jgi:hypothetical protein